MTTRQLKHTIKREGARITEGQHQEDIDRQVQDCSTYA
jgi:hypothetical protein